MHIVNPSLPYYCFHDFILHHNLSKFFPGILSFLTLSWRCLFMHHPSFILFPPFHFYSYLFLGYLITPSAIAFFCLLLFCFTYLSPFFFSMFLWLFFTPHFCSFLHRYNKRCYYISPAFCFWCMPMPFL